MQKVTPSEEHSWWGGGPWTPEGRAPLLWSDPRPAGWLAEPHHAPAARACTPQSAPPVGTQSACRRLTVCSRSRDPSPLARRRSVGLALTLRLPQEDALHLPLPCPRPPVLTAGTLPAPAVSGRAPQEGPSALPGSSQEAPGFREPPGNPAGKRVSAARPAEGAPGTGSRGQGFRLGRSSHSRLGAPPPEPRTRRRGRQRQG